MPEREREWASYELVQEREWETWISRHTPEVQMNWSMSRRGR